MSKNWWVYELRWSEMVEGFMQGFHLGRPSEAREPSEYAEKAYETGVLARIKRDSDE